MFLTIKELSILLKVKPSTLYAWASQGKIPCIKLHGLIRFQKEDIDLWVDSFKRERINIPAFNFKKNDGKEIDNIIEKAKSEVYNTTHGETRPISSRERR